MDELRPCNMGEDQIIGPKHPPVYQSRLPMWIGSELEQCFVRVDELYREDWAAGRRAGNPPRTIIPDPSGERVRAEPPMGLPMNCYDMKWYNSLKPHQRAALCVKEDAIVDLCIPEDIDKQSMEVDEEDEEDEEL